jgi:small nuclear ribonucleoprotein (snRNP)-like protein
MSAYAAARVLVVTSDGRCYVGVLKACDQATNLVLDQAEERIYSTDVRLLPSPSKSAWNLSLASHPYAAACFAHAPVSSCMHDGVATVQEGVKVQPVGLYVVRGDHVYVSTYTVYAAELSVH